MVSPALEGVLGVVGGARTIRSGLYRRALATPRRRVIQRIAQPLSAHIEAGRVGTPAFERDWARILGPLGRANAILLACTHYPSAGEAFRRMAPRALLLDRRSRGGHPHRSLALAARAGDLRDDRPPRGDAAGSAHRLGIELGPCLRTPETDRRRRGRRRR